MPSLLYTIWVSEGLLVYTNSHVWCFDQRIVLDWVCAYACFACDVKRWHSIHCLFSWVKTKIGRKQNSRMLWHWIFLISLFFYAHNFFSFSISVRKTVVVVIYCWMIIFRVNGNRWLSKINWRNSSTTTNSLVIQNWKWKIALNTTGGVQEREREKATCRRNEFLFSATKTIYSHYLSLDLPFFQLLFE